MYGAPRASGSGNVNPVFNGDARINQVLGVNQIFAAVNINGTQDVYNNVDNWPLIMANGPNTFSVDVEMQSPSHPILGAQGFSRYYQCNAIGPAIPANLLVTLGIPIESYDLCDFLNQALTLSFWVNSTLTGAHYVTLYGGATGLPGSGPSYAARYIITQPNTWQQIAMPITFPTANFNITPNGARALTIHFMMIVGTNFRALPAFINTWNAAGSNVYAGTDQQQYTDGRIFQVTDVAIRPGNDASFPRVNFGDALERAKRYYWQTFQYGQTPVQGLGALAQTGAISYRNNFGAAGAVASSVMVRHPRQMRIAPAVTFFNTNAANANWRNLTAFADSGAAAVNAAVSDADSSVIDNPQVAGDAATSLIAVAASFNARL